MRLSQLEGLYQEIILDHYRHPHHYGSLDHPDYQIEMINPSCCLLYTSPSPRD